MAEGAAYDQAGQGSGVAIRGPVESGQDCRGLGPPLRNGLSRWAEHCGGGVGGFIGLILRRMAPTQKMLEGCR